MMYHATVPVKESYSVSKEVIQYATLIYGAFVVEIDGKGAMRYKYYAPNESPPSLLNLLITWVESGVVKTRTKTTTKLSDRGVPCMMVGYNINSGADVYLI